MVITFKQFYISIKIYILLIKIYLQLILQDSVTPYFTLEALINQVFATVKKMFGVVIEPADGQAPVSLYYYYFMFIDLLMYIFNYYIK